MKKRGIRVQVWLNKEENAKLHTDAKKRRFIQNSELNYC